MKKINSTELKNKLGKYLDYVLSEGEVLIIRHGRIIAKIEGVNQTEDEQTKTDN